MADGISKICEGHVKVCILVIDGEWNEFGNILNKYGLEIGSVVYAISSIIF